MGREVKLCSILRMYASRKLWQVKQYTSRYSLDQLCDFKIIFPDDPIICDPVDWVYVSLRYYPWRWNIFEKLFLIERPNSLVLELSTKFMSHWSEKSENTSIEDSLYFVVFHTFTCGLWIVFLNFCFKIVDNPYKIAKAIALWTRIQ